MSRYRPPQQPMSAYITPEGEKSLKEELDYLWRVERPQVTQSVSDAAALGDRSENAEYIYGKKRLREIDRRVRYLRKRLDALTVVAHLPTDTTKVYFGAWVELINQDDKAFIYRIVGPDEINPASHCISIDSVLARALLGKSVDDEVSIITPAGEHNSYEIIAVHYSNPDALVQVNT